jgi:hypothetical protein
MEDYQDLIDKAYELMLIYAPKIVLPILVLVIGMWIFNRFTKATRRTMTVRSVNVSLIGFVSSLTNLGLKAQGHLDVVKEIHIFVTILLSPDSKTIIIPNGAISNGDITNYNTEGKIRVDMTSGISYESNSKTTKDVLMGILTAHIPRC